MATQLITLAVPIQKYLQHYSPHVLAQVQQMLDEKRLAQHILKKYPTPHNIANDQALREYTQLIKNQHMKKSAPLSKVIYDGKIQSVQRALGLHSYVSRVQGGKLKSKHEIRISNAFKKAPEALLNMIVVHELAHLNEKAHNKAFYRLCEHMLPDYHQLEFDMRLYLVQLETTGSLY